MKRHREPHQSELNSLAQVPFNAKHSEISHESVERSRDCLHLNEAELINPETQLTRLVKSKFVHTFRLELRISLIKKSFFNSPERRVFISTFTLTSSPNFEN